MHMFKGKRYLTKGVQEEIPQYLQNLIWYMIEIMQVPQKDYLQVFELDCITKDERIKQQIVHSQEQPSYRTEEIITCQKAIRAKIYVIDESDHCTMLLANEY
jgi:Staphylococcal protein of unknown function (DUF960)